MDKCDPQQCNIVIENLKTAKLPKAVLNAGYTSEPVLSSSHLDLLVL